MKKSKGIIALVFTVFIGLMIVLGLALKLWADTQLDIISQPMFEINEAVKGN